MPTDSDYSIRIVPEGPLYAGRTGHFDIVITRNGRPAKGQPFRLYVTPQRGGMGGSVTPIGGQLHMTDDGGTSRAAVEFTKGAGRHAVSVAVGANEFYPKARAQIVVPVKRVWYQRVTVWAPAIVALWAGLLFWILRRRRSEDTANSNGSQACGHA